MIQKSPYPEVDIPEVSLTALLLERARSFAGKAALIDGPTGRTYTYGEWAALVRRAAAGLARHGLGKGDVLAIYSPNLPEYAIAFHGAALAGGINTTINPLYTVDELEYQLRDSGARYLITVAPFLAKALAAARSVGLSKVFVFDDVGEAEGVIPFASLLADDGTHFREPTIVPREDLVALPYSSGTTGLPKGVMLTHYNLAANLLQNAASPLEVGTDDTIIAVLPFFHIYGLVVVMNLGLYFGATIVTLPRFELESFLATLARYGVTFANVVPPIVLALAKHPAVDQHDLSQLRMIFSGAAPLGAEVAQACARRLGCLVFQGYGLTETSPVTHVSPSDPALAKPGSVGFPLPNTECQIADLLSGAPLGPGERGEICIRGPQNMLGYLNRPEATAAMIDGSGWLHTGYVGYVGEDGHLYVVDRVKELIKYKGLQVAPAELEAVLLTHPAVADAAVIPSPDEEAGEVPKAFVVLRGEATPDELLAFVAARVAPYKRIRRLEIVDQIPKSASGKILRRVLVERERARASRRI
ncbi:MAG TPA: 4-coumarate--CoA ligase family protein [Thermoanaerobaculia bacterium]|jgi:acyl-CoA synthetase (AMP-forming)/AMP-acid ligase II|nr:4-coumarate--CoA ligase family protein [Thermoanaerobaculia bacterium]